MSNLEVLLQQLADESRAVRTINLVGLSDLRRHEAAAVYTTLSGLSARRRLEVVRAMTEQAEANVHLNFLAILRECLADSEPEVRRLAIDGLWEDERPNLIVPLARLLAEDTSAEVRAAAAISLGRFILLGVLGEISDSYAQSAAQAMRAAWARPGEVTEVRRRALEGLAYTDEDGIEELIEAAYYDEDDRMRQSAVFAMGRTADRRWARHVLTELKSHDPAMRYEAAGAAGELALTAAVKPLVQLLDDTDSAVREMAAAALGKIGGPQARRALEACLNSSDRSLAEAAADALDELTFNSDDLETLLMDYSPRNGRQALAVEDTPDAEDEILFEEELDAEDETFFEDILDDAEDEAFFEADDLEDQELADDVFADTRFDDEEEDWDEDEYDMEDEEDWDDEAEDDEDDSWLRRR